MIIRILQWRTRLVLVFYGCCCFLFQHSLNHLFNTAWTMDLSCLHYFTTSSKSHFNLCSSLDYWCKSVLPALDKMNEPTQSPNVLCVYGRISMTGGPGVPHDHGQKTPMVVFINRLCSGIMLVGKKSSWRWWWRRWWWRWSTGMRRIVGGTVLIR